MRQIKAGMKLSALLSFFFGQVVFASASPAQFINKQEGISESTAEMIRALEFSCHATATGHLLCPSLSEPINVYSLSDKLKNRNKKYRYRGQLPNGSALIELDQSNLQTLFNSTSKLIVVPTEELMTPVRCDQINKICIGNKVVIHSAHSQFSNHLAQVTQVFTSGHVELKLYGLKHIFKTLLLPVGKIRVADESLQ